MSATIIQFPVRSRGVVHGDIGDILREVVPIAPRDAELAMLVTMADHLLSSYTDEVCDRFIDRIAAWEAENKRG